jgi:hypothetical protein
LDVRRCALQVYLNDITGLGMNFGVEELHYLFPPLGLCSVSVVRG